jgi:hypothetical protein
LLLFTNWMQFNYKLIMFECQCKGETMVCLYRVAVALWCLCHSKNNMCMGTLKVMLPAFPCDGNSYFNETKMSTFLEPSYIDSGCGCFIA